MQARQLTIEDYILAINALEAEIAQPESIASDKRWEQAEQVWAALDAGMTQERLASEWRKPEWQGGGTYTRVHVSYVARTWEVFRNYSYKPAFYVAYNSDEVRKSRRNGVQGDPPPLPTGTYDVILADPPWRYDFAPTDSRAIENQYPTLTPEEIVAYQPPAAPDAVLFLWATAPKLREALEVVEGWGFDYVTHMIWVKDKIGMGYYARSKHELLLIGRRGEPGLPAESVRPESVFESPRTMHSRKPERAYELIEAMYPDRAYLELFSRSKREGWQDWGNEA